MTFTFPTPSYIISICAIFLHKKCADCPENQLAHSGKCKLKCTCPSALFSKIHLSVQADKYLCQCLCCSCQIILPYIMKYILLGNHAFFSLKRKPKLDKTKPLSLVCRKRNDKKIVLSKPTVYPTDECAMGNSNPATGSHGLGCIIQYIFEKVQLTLL